MVKKFNWRLTEEFDAYFVSNDSLERNFVVIAPIDDKAARKAIGKEYYGKKHLPVKNNSVSAKLETLEDILVLSIKCEEFPNPEEWYICKNFYNEINSLGSIITQNTIENGLISEKFEIVFSMELPGQFSIISSSMKEYSVCLEEFTRRINAVMCKKTKKYIPGHRYDTEKETIYYLCPLKSRLRNYFNSRYLGDGDVVDAFLYVNNLREGYKTVSDVLKNEYITSNQSDKYSIKIGLTIASRADSGEVLTNDFSGNFTDYYENLVDNYMKSTTTVRWTGVESIPDNSDVFLPFSLATEKDIDECIEVTESVKRKLRLWAKMFVRNTYLTNYFSNFCGDAIDTIQEGKEKDTVNLILANLKDTNYSRYDYFTILFSKIGLSNTDLEKENITPLYFRETLGSNLLKVDDLFHFHQPLISRRVCKNTYSYQGRICCPSGSYKKLHDSFSPGLIDVLKRILAECVSLKKSNYCHTYEEKNYGTMKEPRLVVSAVITYKNLYDYITEMDVPEAQTLKHELVTAFVGNISITIDKNVVDNLE